MQPRVCARVRVSRYYEEIGGRKSWHSVAEDQSRHAADGKASQFRPQHQRLDECAHEKARGRGTVQ